MKRFWAIILTVTLALMAVPCAALAEAEQALLDRGNAFSDEQLQDVPAPAAQEAQPQVSQTQQQTESDNTQPLAQTPEQTPAAQPSSKPEQEKPQTTDDAGNTQNNENEDMANNGSNPAQNSDAEDDAGKQGVNEGDAASPDTASLLSQTNSSQKSSQNTPLFTQAEGDASTHSIYVSNQDGRGSYTLSCGTTEIAEGTRLTVTVTPKEGWAVEEVRFQRQKAPLDNLPITEGTNTYTVTMPDCDVWCGIKYKPVGNPPKYQISFEGSANASRSVDYYEYARPAGDLVTITSEGTNGHILSSIEVKETASGTPVPLTGEYNTQFTMPAANVTIYLTTQQTGENGLALGVYGGGSAEVAFQDSFGNTHYYPVSDASNMTVTNGYKATLTATPAAGQRFVGWYEGVTEGGFVQNYNSGTCYSTASPYSYTVTASTPSRICAVFEEAQSEPIDSCSIYVSRPSEENKAREIDPMTCVLVPLLGAPYTVLSAEWLRADGKPMDANEYFNKNSIYKVKVTLKANDGRVWSDGAIATTVSGDGVAKDSDADATSGNAVVVASFTPAERKGSRAVLKVHWSSIDGVDLVEPIVCDSVGQGSTIQAALETRGLNMSSIPFSKAGYNGNEGYWLPKPLTAYSSYSELGAAAISGTEVLNEDTDIYFALPKELTEMEFAVGAPACGTETTSEGSKQTNPPAVVATGAHYALDTSDNNPASWWTTELGDEFFEGKFIGAEKYFIETWFVADFGYTFAENGSAVVRGGQLVEYYYDGNIAGAKASVTAAHDWGEWKKVKEATETDEGLEERTCAGCGEKETRAIPKIAVEYTFTSGNGSVYTKGSGESLLFTVERNVNDAVTFGLLTGIKIDGRTVGANQYTATAGSAIIELAPAFLDSLTEGEHTITAQFKDGEAQASFTMKAAPVDPVKPDSAQPANTKKNPTPATTKKTTANTGDALAHAPIACVVLLSVLVLALAWRKRKN